MLIREIEDIINSLAFVTCETQFKDDGNGVITGDVGILDAGMPTTLCFHTVIYPSYPYKVLGEEPIKFINPSLIEYPHIMAGGSLCLHTTYWTDPVERLKADFHQLLEWVRKYYIRGEIDSHYEHIVVENEPYEGCYYSIQFTQFDKSADSGEFGFAFISYLRDGQHKEKTLKNILLQSIGDATYKNIRMCTWNKDYKGLPNTDCPYVILNSTPCRYNKFALDNYAELTPYLSQEQLQFLHLYESVRLKKRKDQVVPLLFGYRIPTGGLHWLTSITKIGHFPTFGKPQIVNGVKTGKWLTEFTDEKIHWAMSFDASYDLFFGRGSFDKSFTSKSILVLGVGAVGSIVAKTLARCGCTDLALGDYDLKKPENICRSEYEFINGIGQKASELSNQLSAISPHLSVKPLPEHIDYFIKHLGNSKKDKKQVEDILNQFDIIIDCSTDDDLLDILDGLCIRSCIVNISISNHSSELVCAFSPNISRFVGIVFNSIIENDSSDLYEPTGCWSPTFKASYNDIAIMVQYAIRQIYRMLSGVSIKQNFILRDTEDGLKITKY